MYIVVLITASSKKEADKIANKLLLGKLVACVNIIENIKSVFWWEGKIDKAKECLLVVKSKRTKFSGIVKAVKSAHSYQVPEIIALPVISGNPAYLKWINDTVR